MKLLPIILCLAMAALPVRATNSNFLYLAWSGGVTNGNAVDYVAATDLFFLQFEKLYATPNIFHFSLAAMDTNKSEDFTGYMLDGSNPPPCIVTITNTVTLTNRVLAVTNATVNFVFSDSALPSNTVSVVSVSNSVGSLNGPWTLALPSYTNTGPVSLTSLGEFATNLYNAIKISISGVH